MNGVLPSVNYGRMVCVKFSGLALYTGSETMQTFRLLECLLYIQQNLKINLIQNICTTLLIMCLIILIVNSLVKYSVYDCFCEFIHFQKYSADFCVKKIMKLDLFKVQIMLLMFEDNLLSLFCLQYE